MEHFAQSVSSPWIGIAYWQKSNFTKARRMKCRHLAKQLVSGSHENHNPDDRPTPHMSPFNYEYYAKRSIWQFPRKEVFVIRTEQEWQDMLDLDYMLGGSGNFVAKKGHKKKTIKHGSDKYYKSPLSEQSYHKLCCVLEHEIEIYKDILDQATNLSPAAKEATLKDLKDKCGITTTASSWAAWRTTCRERLKRDDDILTKDYENSPEAEE
jgi:hypothetical protein